MNVHKMSKFHQNGDFGILTTGHKIKFDEL